MARGAGSLAEAFTVAHAKPAAQSRFVHLSRGDCLFNRTIAGLCIICCCITHSPYRSSASCILHRAFFANRLPAQLLADFSAPLNHI